MDAVVENRRGALKAKRPNLRRIVGRVLMLLGVIAVAVGGKCILADRRALRHHR